MIMNKIKPVLIYSLYRNHFLSKTQLSLTCAEYVRLFSELHDVKQKETWVVKNTLINSVHLHIIEKSGDT